MSSSAPGFSITCQEVVELITDYLDDTIEAELKAEVQAHLGLCEGCAIYLEQMRATLRLLGRVPVDTLSESAQADLVDAFRDLRRRRDEEDG